MAQHFYRYLGIPKSPVPPPPASTIGGMAWHRSFDLPSSSRGLWIPFNPLLLPISTGGGGGFSDLDWPSLANRPTLSSNILSWVGPIGGGANDGNPQQQHRPLTASGSVTTSANGQVIQGLNISGQIVVNHNNVVIDQSAITLSSPTGTLIDVGPSTTGLIVRDCLINGSRNSYNGFNCTRSPFAWTGNIIQRCTIQGMENGITGNQHDLTIQDNLLWGFGNSGSSTYDGDGIEVYDCANLVIAHNTFDATNSTQAQGILNSAINFSNLGPISNVDVNGNMFINMGPSAPASFIFCDDNGFGGGGITGCNWRNNAYFNKAAATAYRRDSVPLVINSGNFTASSAIAHSGVLINGGTGAV